MAFKKRVVDFAKTKGKSFAKNTASKMVPQAARNAVNVARKTAQLVAQTVQAGMNFIKNLKIALKIMATPHFWIAVTAFLFVVAISAAVKVWGPIRFASACTEEQFMKFDEEGNGTPIAPGSPDEEEMQKQKKECKPIGDGSKKGRVSNDPKTSTGGKGHLLGGLYCIHQGYGQYLSGGAHDGVDVFAPGVKGGEHIFSPVDGKIKSVSNNNGTGMMDGSGVVISFGDNEELLLWHFEYNSIKVKVGDDVKTGQFLGKLGNTGLVIPRDAYHIHVSYSKNGQKEPPLVAFPGIKDKEDLVTKGSSWPGWIIDPTSGEVRPGTSTSESSCRGLEPKGDYHADQLTGDSSSGGGNGVTSFKDPKDQALFEEAKKNLHPSTAGMQPHARELATFLMKKFNINNISGIRGDSDGTGHGHADGLGFDLMVKPGDKLGDDIAKYLTDNYQDMKIYYLIWEQKFYMHTNNKYGAANSWNMMEDRGSITQNHYDHVHISFKRANEP